MDEGSLGHADPAHLLPAVRRYDAEMEDGLAADTRFGTCAERSAGEKQPSQSRLPPR